MDVISRGFTGRRSATDVKLPPGQYLTTGFPVLSAGPTPHISLDRWAFTIDDGTDVLRRWDWKSFRELPTETFTVDLHCVTRWSKLGTSWEGVPLDVLFADVRDRCGLCSRVFVRREPGAVFYGDELRALSAHDPALSVTYAYTRVIPRNWSRPPGRIDGALVADTTLPSSLVPTCYVCGPTSFVESAAGLLTGSGHSPDRIRTERFGPTGERQ